MSSSLERSPPDKIRLYPRFNPIMSKNNPSAFILKGCIILTETILKVLPPDKQRKDCSHATRCRSESGTAARSFSESNTVTSVNASVLPPIDVYYTMRVTCQQKNPDGREEGDDRPEAKNGEAG